MLSKSLLCIVCPQQDNLAALDYSCSLITLCVSYWSKPCGIIMFSNINWKLALFLPVIFSNTWWICLFHWVQSPGFHLFFPSQAFIGCVSEGEQWCCCEFLLWAGGTCVQVGAVPKGFYTCRIPKVYDSLLDAMRYVLGKITDNLSLLMAVPGKLSPLSCQLLSCVQTPKFLFQDTAPASSPRESSSFSPMRIGPDSPH